MKLKNLFFIEEEETKENLASDNSIFRSSDKPNNKSPLLSSDEKSWGIIAHISAVLGYFIPFGNIIAPFVVFHIKKDDSGFIAENARSAFNFQLTISLFLLILSFFSFLMIGDFHFLLIFFVAYFLFILFELIFIALAVMNASKGKIHKYPFAIEFIKKL